MGEKHIRVEAVAADENDALSKCVSMMIWNAWNNGVREDGDQVTIIMPPMEIGPDPDNMVELTGYEIVVRKVGD